MKQSAMTAVSYKSLIYLRFIPIPFICPRNRGLCASLTSWAATWRRVRVWPGMTLALLFALASRAAMTQSVETASQTRSVGEVRLERTRHEPNLLPDVEHAGFGALLYDAQGKLVVHEGSKTWLYSNGLFEAPTDGRRDWYGKWVTHVREFDVGTFVTGRKTLALGLEGSDQWAVIHDVVRVSDQLFVAFYSTNGGIGAAISNAPNGRFETVSGFKIPVTEAWERQGGEIQSVESNGAHVLVEESDRALTLWLGYDSYHVDRTSGQLGWAKIRIDKAARTVALLGKYAGNPLPLRPQGYIAARCGGNLGTDVPWGSRHAFVYYTRPNRQRIMLTIALSSDRLFHDAVDIVEFEPPLGAEKVIEKFEAYMFGGELHIIYENQLASGHWGTGIRTYKIHRQLPRS
jgi:hypothetical protein